MVKDIFGGMSFEQLYDLTGFLVRNEAAVGLDDSMMRRAASWRVLVMVKPGKVNGRALMTTDLHRPGVFIPFHAPRFYRKCGRPEKLPGWTEKNHPASCRMMMQGEVTG